MLTRSTTRPLIAALALAAPPAKAQESGDTIAVSVSGSEAEATAITGAVREPLERLGFRLTTAAAGARARVQIDAAPGDHIDVHVSADPPDGQAVHRTVHRGEPEPIVIEQVAYVVRTTLESMLGLRRERPPPSSAPSETLPERPFPSAPVDASIDRPVASTPSTSQGPRVRFALAPFFTERAMSSATLVEGAGLSFGATLFDDRPFRPTLWLSVSANSSFDAGTADAMVAGVQTWSLRLVPSFGLLRLGAFSVDAGIGGGADFFGADVAMVSENRPDGTFAARLSTPASFVDPVVAAQVVLGYRVSPHISLTLGGSADYDLAPHRYAMSSGAGVPGGIQAGGSGASETRVLFEPWHLRPGILAGIRMSLD